MADPAFLKVSPLSPDFLHRQVCECSNKFVHFFQMFFAVSELDIIWVDCEIARGKVEKSSRCSSSPLAPFTFYNLPFLNPGFEFEVVTFERTGCLGVGAWTPEASWYPGYLWKACICPKCRYYLIPIQSETD